MGRVRKMSPWLVVVATLMFGFSTGFAGAEPAGPPVGGCPSGGGWFLGQVEGVEKGIDVGNAADKNGDGWVCVRFNSGLGKKRPAAATITDNTVNVE